MKKRVEFIQVVKYILYFAAMYLLSRAKIGSLAPFAFAFFAALIFLKQNVFVLTPLYICAGFLYTLSPQSLIYLAFEGVVLGGCALVHKYARRELKLYLFLVYMLISKGLYLGLYFSGGGAEVIVSRIVDSALSLIFALAFTNGLRALVVRGMRFRSTVDENVSLLLLLIAVYTGMCGAYIYRVDVSVIAAVFLILIAANVYGSGGGGIAGAALGLGALVYSGSTVPIAAFVLYGLTAGIFFKTSKYLAAAAVVICELILSYFFTVYESYSYINLLTVILPCVLSCLLTKRQYQYIATLIGGGKREDLSRYVVNRSRFEMSRKLLEMSDVFKEMELMYERLIFGDHDGEEALPKMCEDLKAHCCADCPERARCEAAYSDKVGGSFSALLGAGLSKGKVTLLELDRFLTGRCVKVNTVLQTANRLLGVHRQNCLLRRNIDSGKALTARQMGAVSKVFKHLADKENGRVVYDEKRERLLIDELCFNNIVCNEVMVIGDRADKPGVSLVIPTRDALKNEIAEVVSKVFGCKMMIVGRENIDREGWAAVTLKPVPQLDAVYGVASAKKYGSKSSGDTHSLLKISESKLMLCLCDGMGSGEMAQKISTAAVSLVENFYLAGFDSDVILNSVNKLLAYAGGDAFAAIDIAAIDLSGGRCDFIKIGAVESYVKTDADVKEIAGSSLPLGILEDITPWSENLPLSAGDMLVLATDGVREAFAGGDAFREYLAGHNTLNPKALADEIIRDAVRLTDSRPTDDMTVIACKMVKS